MRRRRNGGSVSVYTISARTRKKPAGFHSREDLDEVEDDSRQQNIDVKTECRAEDVEDDGHVFPRAFLWCLAVDPQRIRSS